MDIIRSKFGAKLQTHVEHVNIEPLSRIPLTRIVQKAVEHIGVIDLITGDVFARRYAALYEAMFHGGERERHELIVDRLKQEFAGMREGLAPFRVVGIQDREGNAIAAAQFCVLFLKQSHLVVPYLQYIYVRPENRRQDLSELLHTLVLAVTEADAARRYSEQDQPGRIPFTLFETEPPCHGVDASHRANAEKRATIHAKSGSVALMLRRKSNGALVSSHVQPGLDGPGDPPVTLVWALRANPAVEFQLSSDDVGHALIAAYYQNLRDEGFSEENITYAESLLRGRCQADVEFCMIPLAEITSRMYVEVDSFIEDQ